MTVNILIFATRPDGSAWARSLKEYGTQEQKFKLYVKRKTRTFQTSEMQNGWQVCPFLLSVDNAPSEVQFELIDLQSDNLLAEHFESVSLSVFFLTKR
ncbi:hypothetical protein ATANTOWER_017735 [Ataeniobius toweri]|uniref:Uncharacterized protein n=1 Tax=Ataeniobius toweri TaxID=208326 RepID=A0ABU7BTV8_9TELE|nr:hypothetical protein [Ataeniobius toweri]